MHNLFYISARQIKGDHIVIDKKELHHVKNVLRIKRDDIVWLTDGAGNRFQTKVISIERNKLAGQILAKEYVKRANKVNLVLAFAPIKGSRNDIIIEKGTELGVSRFRPFISKYSVIKKLTKQRIERFQRVALSAMLQSKQYYLPDFTIFENIDTLLGTCIDFDLVVLADEQGNQQVPHGARNLLYIVGPEGGFDKPEIQLFKDNGVKLLSLGSNRLRSETAAIVGISKILAAYGQI
ncbi:MAG: RsmE family RNA methyltransferase [bacterium]